MMVKYFILILPLLLLTQGLRAQVDLNQLSEIESLKENIQNELPSYRRLEKIKNDSGSKVVYFKDDELKLITVYSKDDYLDKNVAWYFSKGKLFYSEQVWIDLSTVEISKHEKVYLSKGKLIAWEKTDKSFVDVHSTEFKMIDEHLSGYAEKLQKENN